MAMSCTTCCEGVFILGKMEGVRESRYDSVTTLKCWNNLIVGCDCFAMRLLYRPKLDKVG